MKSQTLEEPAQPLHIPVMVPEVLSFLPDKEAQYVIDATLGEGGHSSALCKALPPDSHLLSFEVDSDAIASVQNRFAKVLGKQWEIVHASYTSIETVVRQKNWPGVDFVLFDVGISSRHVEDKARGFSFGSGVVDMRMDQDLTITAADMLNVLPIPQLAYIFETYGDYSKRQAMGIAETIDRYRQHEPFGNDRDSTRLQSIAKKIVGHRLHHPGTVIFQALRIAVNNEFESITTGLTAAWNVLRAGGVIVVLSYHSGEHKLVEAFLRKHEDTAEVHLEPQYPTMTEIETNRRSRSAQLRWLRKNS